MPLTLIKRSTNNKSLHFLDNHNFLKCKFIQYIEEGPSSHPVKCCLHPDDYVDLGFQENAVCGIVLIQIWFCVSTILERQRFCLLLVFVQYLPKRQVRKYVVSVHTILQGFVLQLLGNNKEKKHLALFVLRYFNVIVEYISIQKEEEKCFRKNNL